ncbi:MAG: hypothetical protein WBC97_11985 [Gemmatimonadales bacterium]
MMQTIRIALFVVVLGGVPLGARAQAVPDSAAIRAARATLDTNLRNIATAQEAYFADHEAYASSVHMLADVFRSSAGVTVVIVTASDATYSALATIDRVPGLVCEWYLQLAAPPLGTGNPETVDCRGP